MELRASSSSSLLTGSPSQWMTVSGATMQYVDGSVGLQEVGLQVDLEPVSRETLDTVINGENVNPLAILDIRTALDGNNISKSDSEIVPDNAVHPDLVVSDGVVRLS